MPWFRLRTLTSQEGAIRLPVEDGPPAEIFNEDEELDSDEQLQQQLPKSQSRAAKDQLSVQS